MGALVNQLVFLSRMDEDTAAPPAAEFDLNATALDTVSEFEGLAAEQHKALTASIAPSVSYRGDEGMIRRLLSILLDNAVKYCDPGGDITAYKKSDACIGFRAVVGSAFFSVNTYTADAATEDYIDVALSDLTEAGSTAYIYFDSDTEFYTVESGALVSAADDDVTEGAMIAETTADDGTQQIIILAAGETQESIDAEIAEVTAVDGDTLTLTVYALTEDASDYEITDAADIDLSNYETSSETATHTLLSTDVIQVSADGSAVSADSSEIAVGDMLAIYTDPDSGYTTLVVYHSDTV